MINAAPGVFGMMTAALHLVEVTGAAGNAIEINPELVTELRGPRQVDHFPANVRCVIFTVDGRIVGSREACDTVKRLLQQR